MPAIVVLVKHVPDTWSTKTLTQDFTLERQSVDNVIDEINEYAVEQALRIKDTDDSYRVIAATMGSSSADEALRKALAMGADDAIRLTDDALVGSDAIATAFALNGLISMVDDVQLIITGTASSDGETGLVPSLLAEYRQLPALTGVTGLSVSDGTATASRIDALGTWSLSAPLPAVVSVTDRAEKPRYPNFKRMRAAKAHEITVYDLAGIGVDASLVGLNNSATRVTGANDRPARTAGDVIYESDPAAAAKAIADFLDSRNLI